MDTKKHKKPTKKQIRDAASILRSVRTEKRSAASRENGKKGGRPRKALQ